MYQVRIPFLLSSLPSSFLLPLSFFLFPSSSRGDERGRWVRRVLSEREREVGQGGEEGKLTEGRRGEEERRKRRGRGEEEGMERGGRKIRRRRIDGMNLNVGFRRSEAMMSVRTIFLTSSLERGGRREGGKSEGEREEDRRDEFNFWI
jgi:hypothetical protein